MTFSRSLKRLIAASLTGLVLSQAALAQSFPAKPVSLMVPYG